MCVFWNQSLIVSSISVLCAVPCPRRLSNHSIRPSPQSSTETCSGSPRTSSVSTGAKVAVATDVITVSEIGFAASFLRHFLLWDVCLPDPCAILKKSLTLNHCALNKLDAEQEQDDSFYEISGPSHSRWMQPSSTGTGAHPPHRSL